MALQLREMVSVGTATIVSLLTFLFGISLSAYLYVGSTIPNKCYEAGSDADWWAAAGTWMIGVGAIMYSARELGIKIHERREARMAELSSVLAQYAAISYTATSVAGRVRSFRDMLARAIEIGQHERRLPYGFEAFYLAPMKDALSDITWDRNISVPIGIDGLKRLGAATYYADRCRSLLSLIIEESKSEGDSRGFDLIVLAREFEDLLDRLANELTGIPDELQKDAAPARDLIERLRARIEEEDRALLGD
ncbi:hypothetical protein [Stenotrophomonas maltophilia]|uniref:hypothetical protein n=1 Tax=Stenotrophomonas maltophilia group TaxID=995085 RepID=UPI00070C57A7|nr:hypothetical protein [Stenotrophomonas maltophilia]KRG53392.1 hypothetical protein ARC02_12330 [Stenotrophomonas maltophilia]NNH47890.1 hypothetical protein [Stenotrophomonas maltophilia]